MKSNVDLTLNRDFQNREISNALFGENNIKHRLDTMLDDLTNRIPWKQESFILIDSDTDFQQEHTYNMIFTGDKAERKKKKFYNSEYDETICYCCGEKIAIPWTERGCICKKCQTNDNGKHIPWEV